MLLVQVGRPIIHKADLRWIDVPPLPPPSRLPAHEPQPIAGGVVEVLTQAQVALGGLDGGVAERDLDLLERRAALVGELGEGSA